MMQSAWEQAFALMADHGQCGACQFVAAAMRKTPSADVVQYQQWDVLGSGLIDHSQKMTVAASATAEKKTVGQRS